jgi:glycosyltransferase involved in cell wall biosynthesis
MTKIAWIHTDILNRTRDFEKGLYPKSHLWGYPFKQNEETHFLNPLIFKIWLRGISKFYNLITKSRLGNLLVEISLLLKLNEFDLIYCVSGKLFWIPILKRLGLIKTKLVILIYRIPEKAPFWKFHNLHLSENILRAFDGINCLTQKTADELLVRLGKDKEIKYLPWCTDEKLFLNNNKSEPKYFFSSGKTNRDYETLLDAIKRVPEKKFILIGHFSKIKTLNQIANLDIIHSTKQQTDSAISYTSLKKHYSEAIAVCIPLNGDPNDTCGYTELLEAMAMAKPVLMTRSGCLDINIEEENIGYYIDPNDPHDWARKIDFISNNNRKASIMGANGRKLIDKTYNVASYENRVREFLYKISHSK